MDGSKPENRLFIPEWVMQHAIRQDASASASEKLVKYFNRQGATFYKTTGKLWACLARIHSISLCNGGEQTEDAMRQASGQLIATLDELDKILKKPAPGKSPAYLKINPDTLIRIRDYCKLIRLHVTNYLEATHNTKAARRKELIEFVRSHDDEMSGLCEAWQTTNRQGRKADPGTGFIQRWYAQHIDRCSRMSWAECEAWILDMLESIGADFRSEEQQDAYEKLLPVSDHRPPGDRLQKIISYP